MLLCFSNDHDDELIFSCDENNLYGHSMKDCYCVHSVFLKFLLEKDMICLDAVYELVEMKVGYVKRNYIDKMTRNRQIAEDDMRKSEADSDEMIDAQARKKYYKLKANSVFGKTIQNDTNFSDSTFVRNLTQFHKATLGKVHMDSVIIGQNLDFVYNCLSETQLD